MDNLKMITTFIGATATGVLLGMLFAPQKGSSTRNKISEKSHEYTDYVSEKFDDIINSISYTMENAQEQTEQMADKAKSKSRKAAKKAKKAAAEVNSKS